MNIYAIGDLHLSGEPPTKPMEVFGAYWLGHKEKIKNNWLNTVQAADTVIVCGDISWAMGIKNAAEDLAWLAQLPGRKLLLRGHIPGRTHQVNKPVVCGILCRGFHPVGVIPVFISPVILVICLSLEIIHAAPVFRQRVLISSVFLIPEIVRVPQAVFCATCCSTLNRSFSEKRFTPRLALSEALFIGFAR